MYVCDVYAQYVYIISNIYVFLWKTTRRRSEYAHPSNRLGYEINTFRPGAIGDQRSSSGVAFSSSIVVIHPETWLFFFFLLLLLLYRPVIPLFSTYVWQWMETGKRRGRNEDGHGSYFGRRLKRAVQPNPLALYTHTRFSRGAARSL